MRCKCEAMRIKKCTKAFTLIEMLVVVSIIAVLVTIVISIATRLDTQGKISSTQGTFALVNTALSEFQDYGYCYENPFDVDFKFPLDCNGFSSSDLETALAQGCDISNVTITSGTHEPNYSECEALYFFLNRLPACEKIMSQIDIAFLTNLDRNGVRLIIHINGSTDDYPLFRFTDAWHNTLRYDYYDAENISTVTPRMRETIKTFPVLTSAGPDGDFDTADDIKSR